MLEFSCRVTTHCWERCPPGAFCSMKTALMIFCGGFLFAGCAHNRGGVSEDYYQGYGTRTGTGTNYANPASPTFRPGLNPEDARDPNGMKVPLRVPPS